MYLAAALGRVQAAVVRLDARHEMLNISFAGAGEVPTGVRNVVASFHPVDGLRLQDLWIGVIVRVVWGATVFRSKLNVQYTVR